MLDIVLLILKIIGILLLAVLCLLLTVVVLVLLVPIRYRIQASYHESLKAAVRVSWLLRLVSVFVTYDEALEYSVKLLGFTLFSSDEDEVADDRTAGDGMVDGQTSRDEMADGQTAGDGVSVKEGISKDTPQENALEDIQTSRASEGSSVPEMAVMPQASQTSDANADDFSDHISSQKAETSKKALILSKIKSRIAVLCDKIKALQQKASQIQAFITDPDNQETFKLILRQVKALVRHMLPKKLNADVVMGFDDPATTGQVLSICSFLYIWYEDSIRITPVFDESILEADVELKGRMRLGTMAALALRILFNKNFRVLLKRWRVNGGLLDGRE